MRKGRQSEKERGTKTEETEPKQNQQNMIIPHLVMFFWLFELSSHTLTHTHTCTVTRSTRSYSLYLLLSVAASAKYIKREHLCLLYFLLNTTITVRCVVNKTQLYREYYCIACQCHGKRQSATSDTSPLLMQYKLLKMFAMVVIDYISKTMPFCQKMHAARI